MILAYYMRPRNFSQKNFEMKDMGEASCVIGIEIIRDRSQGLLGLSQKAYINKVLERFKMKYALQVSFQFKKGISLVLCNVQIMSWNAKKWNRFLMHLSLAA